MGNAYPASGDRKHFSTSSSAVEGSTWEQDADINRVSLVEENERLRTLVVQLSNLVLRNVVDQHNTPPMQPMRRWLPD